MVLSVSAIFAMRLYTSCIFVLVPMMLSKRYFSFSSFLR